MKKINAIIISMLIVLSYLAVLSPISAATLDVGTGKTYETIQGAIEHASEGDVIEVYSGTYNEDLNITKDNLVLKSATGANVKIKDIEYNSSFPHINITGNNVKLNGFTIEGPEVPDGNCSKGIVVFGTDIEISNNVFVSFGKGACIVIQTDSDTNLSLRDVSGLNIHDNNFQGNPVDGFIGIKINYTDPKYSTLPVNIQKNSFTGNILYAIVTERSNTNVINNQMSSSGISTIESTGVLISEATKKPQEGVNVYGNIIKNFNTAGIIVGGDSQVLKNININNNLIQNNQIGIKTRSSASGIKINNNTILSNIKYEVQNTDGYTLDARLNWWGSNAGPVRSKISGNVTYLPWVKYSEFPESSISKILKKNQDKKNSK